MLELNPTIPRADELRSWFKSTSGNVKVGSLSTEGIADVKRLSIKEAIENNSGIDNYYFELKASITGIFRSVENVPWYKSAPDGSNKKVIADTTGTGWIEPVTKKQYSHYVPRLTFMKNKTK